MKQVYLEGLEYRDLKITVKDGMITDYTCGNFDREEDNRRYIEENILFHHPSLPMGEFAVGTNTTAYAMARKYGIQEKLPILIAEKTGPPLCLRGYLLQLAGGHEGLQSGRQGDYCPG